MDNQKISLEEAKEIGEQIGINWNEVKFALEDFHKGFHVELEHGTRDPQTNVTNDDSLITGKIAWAHLKELPDYYQRLAKIEGEEY